MAGKLPKWVVDNLSPKHIIFCQEYISTGDKIGAYQIAYPEVTARESARVAANRLLRREAVKRYVAQLKRQRISRMQLRGDAIVEQLMAIAFFDITDVAELKKVPNQFNPTQMDTIVEFIETNKWNDFTKAAIASIKLTRYGINIEAHDKVGALKMLAKELQMAMAVDKTENEDIQQVIIMDDLSTDYKPGDTEQVEEVEAVDTEGYDELWGSDDTDDSWMNDPLITGVANE